MRDRTTTNREIRAPHGGIAMADIRIEVESPEAEYAHDLADDLAEAVHEVLNDDDRV